MGHAASIARKYSPSKEPPSKGERYTEAQADDDDDEDPELASVSSYRPTSPLAHSDARSFMLDITPRKQHREPGHYSNRSSYHSNRALVPYGSREPSYTTVSGTMPSYASSSQSRFRSMKEVRAYINSNPELLVKKKKVKSEKDKLGGFDDITARHKQIKTKQRVYLSLINSSPIIYAMGARPDNRQLRVNQNVYLNLMYPTQDRRLYQERAHRWRSPLQHNDMVVVRKDNYKQPNGHIKQPLSKVRGPRTYSQQMVLPQLSQKSKAASSQSKERALALMTAPPRSRQPLPPPTKARQKASNDHVIPPVTSTKTQPQKVDVETANHRSWSRKENGRAVIPVQKAMTRQRSNASEATVEFTFNVEDLNLKKKSEVAGFELDKDKGKVVPLYFRKSLAYSPKYMDDGLLSSPL